VRVGVDKAEQHEAGLDFTLRPLSLSPARSRRKKKNTGYRTAGVVVVAGLGGGEGASIGAVEVRRVGREDTFRSPGGYTYQPSCPSHKSQ
jgi:hypothetical protein